MQESNPMMKTLKPDNGGEKQYTSEEGISGGCKAKQKTRKKTNQKMEEKNRSRRKQVQSKM
eukprot:1013574-Ditylum_brightwellii.AAC.1